MTTESHSPDFSHLKFGWPKIRKIKIGKQNLKIPKIKPIERPEFLEIIRPELNYTELSHPIFKLPVVGKKGFNTFNAWYIGEKTPFQNKPEKSGEDNTGVYNKNNSKRYMVEAEPIDQGAFSDVYRGYDLRSGRMVCVKKSRYKLPKNILSKLFRNNTQVGMFINEAKTMASNKLFHEVLPEIYDYYVKDNTPMIVMQYFEEGNLFDMRNNGPLSIEQISTISDKIASLIDYLESKGLHHGDIKPENLYLTENGLKLSDFGSAIWGENKTKFFFGTPNYVAGEIFYGANPSLASEEFSYATTMYNLMFNHLPFIPLPKNSETAMVNSAVLSRKYLKITEADRKILNLNYSQAKKLDELFFKALNSDPSTRFQSAAEFNRALQEIIKVK